MFLPLGDAPNPRGIPVITYALVAANVAVYVLITLPLSSTPPRRSDPLLPEYVRVVSRALPEHVPAHAIIQSVSAYDLFVFRNGFRPAAPHLPNLFYSLFLHASFLHLFGNMLFLWIYGDNVEHRLGAWRFLLAYLGTGVAATVFHTVVNPDSQLPVVGASGAISGVLGFYFVWFPRNQVRLLVLFFPLFMRVILVPARLVLGAFLVLDNLLPFLIARGVESGGVAHGAHLGGFIAGLAVAWLVDRWRLFSRPDDYHDVDTDRAPSADAIRQAFADGRLADAAQMYFALDRPATRGFLAPADSLGLADWLRSHGHAEAALTVYRRHLRDYASDPSAAAAHLGAGLIQLEALDQPTPAYQHFLAALDANPSPDVAAHARAALDAIAARQKRQIGYPTARRWG
jgi:membrane associated rhomboid family serine protease